jgi:hypothetical protein
MNLHFVLVLFLLFLTLAAPVRAKDEPPVTTFEIPSVGGWVMDPGQVVLIVSSPETGELYFIDTTRAKDLRTVRLPFKPDKLALQGDQLFVSVRGSSLVHALDAKSGRMLRRYKLPGTAIQNLACHPVAGAVFASNLDEQIVVLDPDSTAAEKTNARGMFLTVDPKTGRYLYTATNRPSRDVIEVREGAGGTAQLQFVTVAETAAVLKYEIGPNRLKLVGGNANTALGAGGYLHVSPDGQRYVMVAGGGWWSTTNQRVRYDIAVFETADMTTMLGDLKCGAPQAICFHPVLDVGVAQGNNTDFYVFDAQSLIHRSQRRVTAGGPVKFWHNLLTFCGKGTKIATLQGNYLHLMPLELTGDERKQLTERYGRLPRPTKVAARESMAAKVSGKQNTPSNNRPVAASPVTKQHPPLVEIVNAPNCKVANASPDVDYLTDRTYALFRVPDSINGGSLLVRPARSARAWLGPGQLNVLREGKAFVALLVSFNGQMAVNPQTLKSLASAGWEAETGDFVIRKRKPDAEVWKWQVFSRKVTPGPLDVGRQIPLQAPTQAIFLFR